MQVDLKAPWRQVQKYVLLISMDYDILVLMFNDCLAKEQIWSIF